MENKKKTIFNVVFLLVVFVGTIYGVFYGEDLGEIAQIIKTVNPLWLIPGVACVVVFIWGESIIIYYMMHTLGIRLKKRTCFLFSSVGFFFSCITPSASGGQPAQIYYMKKEKIPIPVCNSDADPGISSSACKRHHGKGTCPYRENAFDEAAKIKT